MGRRHAPVREQVVVVVGADSDIGRSISMAAAKAGATLALVTEDPEAGGALARVIRHEGGRALLHTTDVHDRAALEDMAATIHRELGRVDTWIDAGDDEAVHSLLAALPYVRGRGGTLIHVAGQPTGLASRGIRGFVDELARRVAEDRMPVDVILVEPDGQSPGRVARRVVDRLENGRAAGRTATFAGLALAVVMLAAVAALVTGERKAA